LGSPLRTTGASPELLENFQQATHRAFARVVQAALDYEVDFMVISGDVYDAEARSVEANRFLVEQLTKLHKAGIPSFIIYGNHDPVGDKAELLTLPESTTVFGSENVGSAAVGPAQTPLARVLGQSYRVRAESRKMYRSFTPAAADVPNVGLLHTALDPDSTRYVPCSVEDLRSKTDIHYWALGHLHSARVLYADSPLVVYPGTPQGRHVGEPGPKCCVLTTLSPTGAANLEAVATPEVIWCDEVLNIDAALDTPPDNLDELLFALLEQTELLRTHKARYWEDQLPLPVVNGGHIPEGYVVRWTVTGHSKLEPLVEADIETREYFTERLRQRFAAEAPFVWTADVRLNIEPPLPTADQLEDDDPVLAELDELISHALNDDAFMKELRAACGQLWYEPRDHEDRQEDSFALTEQRLTELIEAAGRNIRTSVLQERIKNVD
jgi:DNA repair exonuclease SbcCD nuclease subunit